LLKGEDGKAWVQGLTSIHGGWEIVSLAMPDDRILGIDHAILPPLCLAQPAAQGKVKRLVQGH
jgi:hypothetical protein